MTDKPWIEDDSQLEGERLELRWIPVSKIPELLWEDNPKTHSLSELWDSILKFGFIDPPKLDFQLKNVRGGQGGLIFGNGRSEALFFGWEAKQRGDYAGDAPKGILTDEDGNWFMPVKVGLDAESEAMAADFGIFHNTSTMLGGDFADGDIWNLFDKPALLKVGKKVLSDRTFEPLAMTGEEVDSLLRFLDEGKEPPPAPDAQIDKAEELNKKWKVQTGQLWLIPSQTGRGTHRLLCGDSTKAEDVQRLMEGDKSDLVLTDPPYGVSIGDKNKFLNSFQPSGRSLENIANDTADVNELKIMLTNAFKLTKSYMQDCCSIYLTAPQGGELGMMMMMMMEAGLPIRHILIWAKNAPTFSMGRLDYEYQHEPILYTWNKKHEFYGNGAYKSSLWFVDKPRASGEHPTMKPVELFANAVLNSSDTDMIVHDPFAGSGTTGIACEQHRRQSRLMEYEPRFCAVILQRMQDMGLEPVLEA